ncbi:signal peptidase I [Mucilaginibacter sp. 14171R-50]|uniref:signal peptidase I n=1 Tax=Mucilaginibacter sp. 14171R-50 TaxID=2703789 RepID=UPI00138D57EE|nr:signal peptidase I [Mucilaginibacter sp. 14171R-50]QHS56943.1 signal peptidase I [Mucilaginibacter sp. 14171R-50]
MKKSLTAVAVIAFVLVCLWYLLKVTYVFAVYKVPTDANKPAIKPGDVIYASRLAEPGLNKFLCFQKPGIPLSIFRCVGLPNDVIEIKTGIVYKNGQPLDEPWVWNEYLINKATLNSIIGYVTVNGHDLYTVNDSTASVAISKNDLRELKLNLQRRVTAKDSVNEMISKAYPGTHYNEDNFGPVKIPANSYFVLGDDRHNAADSRYIGFINKDEIKATVINK